MTWLCHSPRAFSVSPPCQPASSRLTASLPERVTASSCHAASLPQLRAALTRCSLSLTLPRRMAPPAKRCLAVSESISLTLPCRIVLSASSNPTLDCSPQHQTCLIRTDQHAPLDCRAPLPASLMIHQRTSRPQPLTSSLCGACARQDDRDNHGGHCRTPDAKQVRCLRSRASPLQRLLNHQRAPLPSLAHGPTQGGSFANLPYLHV